MKQGSKQLRKKRIMKIPIDAILPNPEQPRIDFKETQLSELAESIRQNGLINAIAVEDVGNGSYILIDGERRFRACKLIGKREIEATVFPGGSKAKKEGRLIQALVANMHRSDLNPIEEARAMQKLRAMGMSNIAISNRLKCSGPKVVARLKLLELPGELQDLVRYDKLSADMRVTEALLSLPGESEQVKMGLRLARPGVTIGTVVAACEKYHELKRSQPMKSEIPAVEIAAKKAQRNDVPAWSQLEKSGAMPPWSRVKYAAKQMCTTCDLYSMANEMVCKTCPGLGLIIGLMERADERA